MSAISAPRSPWLPWYIMKGRSLPLAFVNNNNNNNIRILVLIWAQNMGPIIYSKYGFKFIQNMVSNILKICRFCYM